MLLILKRHEPEALTEYKQQSGAYYEGLQCKEDVKSALLLEQGHLCAYCMRRITLENMQIEHYIPQTVDPTKALDYRNMLGVCDGNKGNPKKSTTCDNHRGNKLLVVDPLNWNTLRQIKYDSGDGRIYSDDIDINKDLNETLNLNCNLPGVMLKKNRHSALTALREYLVRQKCKGTWSKEFLSKVKERYLKQGGPYKEYMGIMEVYIDKLIMRSSAF